jgi:dienelactone hydrolase
VPPPDPLAKEDPETAETREVQLDDDFITVRLHIPPTAEPRKPTVITMGERARPIKEGFVAVTYRINWELLNPPPPPPPPADKAVGKWVLASPAADVLGKQYLESIATTANRVIPKIIDYLVTVPEVDPKRIAIMGSSSNGFVTLQAVARDRRIVAAVALAACADYHTFLRDSSMGMEGQPLALDPDYEKWLRKQELVRRPQRMVHAAVLMVNRRGDPVIPFSCVEPTATAFTRAYRRARVPDRFRFVVFESDRHGLDVRDADETWSWLLRWLRTPPSSTPVAKRPRRTGS